MQEEFPYSFSYNRFVELTQQVVMPMTIFLKTSCLRTCSGISFLDSTPIRVCKNKIIKRNNVFNRIAEVGKSLWDGSIVSNYKSSLMMKEKY